MKVYLSLFAVSVCLLLSCMLYIPAFSGKLAAIFFYGSIILFAVSFLFYRIKVSKVKVWRGVLEATLMLLLTLSLLLLLLLALFFNIGFSPEGTQ